MNLNLIRKYEKEFLHMLHGGSLMFKPNDKQVWFDSVTSPIDWTVDGLYVIDDMYSTYRKALAEGKTVQHNLANSGNWRDITTDNFIDPLTFNDGTPCYRIKPEEPAFKVGDWVKVNGPAGTFIECISGISHDVYALSGTNICYKSQASKWNPTRGDVCIVWDDDFLSSTAIIKFDYINDSGQYRATDNTCWDNCMPFEGKLPPHMKDKK